MWFVLTMLLLAAVMILPFILLIKVVGFIAVIILPIKFVSEWITGQKTSLMQCVLALTINTIAVTILYKFTSNMFIVGTILAIAGGFAIPAVVYSYILNTSLIKGAAVSIISGLLTIIFLLIFFKVHIF